MVSDGGALPVACFVGVSVASSLFGLFRSKLMSSLRNTTTQVMLSRDSLSEALLQRKRETSSRLPPLVRNSVTFERKNNSQFGAKKKLKTTNGQLKTRCVHGDR